jgi:glycosyltransferase involved in cell wall biosynthesis
MQPPGGGNGVAAWMLQALLERFDVTLLTFERYDPAPIDRFYGTSLAGRDVRVLSAAPTLYPLLARLPLPLGMLRTSLMLRTVQRLAASYDLVVSANNEADFGRPGLQYIHYPWRLLPRPPADHRWYHARAALSAYYGLCDRLAAVTREGVARNLSLVNSDWTGRLTKRWYGDVPTRTLYPPVAGTFPSVPWEAREDGFVCLGRIAPEKNLDRVIDIVAEIRRTMPAARLHLVGTAGSSAYSRRILARVERERAWVTFHGDLPRPALVEFLGRQRYGLHGMTDEHFGMGVAEMVTAGCVVFVPDDGGQVEIVGDARLTYHTDADGVARIRAVLDDPALREALRAHLAARAPRFSSARFVEELGRIAEEFVAATARPA